MKKTLTVAALTLASAAVLVLPVRAATDVSGFIRLSATDTSKTDNSFTLGTHWEDGNPPTSGHGYYVPAGMTNYVDNTSDPSFAGDVLALSGCLFVAVGSEHSVTVDDLRLMDGSTYNANGISKFFGNMTVEASKANCATFICLWPDGYNSIYMNGSLKGEKGTGLLVKRSRRFSSYPKVAMPDLTLRVSGDWSEFYGTLILGAYGGISANNTSPLPGGIEMQNGSWWNFDRPDNGELIVGDLDMQTGSSAVFYFGTSGQSQYFTVTNSFSHGAITIRPRDLSLPMCVAFTNYPLIRLTGPAAAADFSLANITLDDSYVEAAKIKERMGPYPSEAKLELVQKVEDGVKTLYLQVGEPLDENFIYMIKGNHNYTASGTAFYPGNGSYWSNNEVPEISENNTNTYITLKQLTFPRDNSVGLNNYNMSNACVIIAPGQELYNQSRVLRLKELHVTAMPTSGGYPACYGMRSYSGDHTKDFYAHVIAHPGATGTEWAFFYVQTDGETPTTLAWYGEISGDANIDFSSGKYATSFRNGTWYLYSVATNFHGNIRLYSAAHSVAAGNHAQFYLNDVRTLGGTCSSADAWRSIWFYQPFVHIVGDMDVTEATRSVYFQNTTRLDVFAGREFALHVPATFNGAVNKIGTGTLTLGDKACYLNTKGTNNTGAPAANKNVLNVLEGALRVDATNAVDGLAITFSAGASLVLPADSADESLKEKGMFNVKWSAPLAFDDAKLKVVFTNAAESVAPDGRFTRGICTLKTAAVTSLGLTAGSFSVTPPFRGERVKVLEVTSATDAATDTVTFSATFGKIGSMLILR